MDTTVLARVGAGKGAAKLSEVTGLKAALHPGICAVFLRAQRSRLRRITAARLCFGKTPAEFPQPLGSANLPNQLGALSKHGILQKPLTSLATALKIRSASSSLLSII